MLALVSTGQVQPGRLDEVIRIVSEVTIFKELPGFKRYDFLVDRTQNRTLAISLLETQADVDALLASPAIRDALARVTPMYVAGTTERGVWEVAVQR